MQLLGRHAGFIAANATLARPDQILCLVPEMPFTLDRDGGVIDVLAERLTQRVHAVIVASEGVALGPAAALFVGLAICGFDESLSDADGLGLLREVGLVPFTFIVGLRRGRRFSPGSGEAAPSPWRSRLRSWSPSPACVRSSPRCSTSRLPIAPACSPGARRTRRRAGRERSSHDGRPGGGLLVGLPSDLPGLGGSHLRCVLAEAPQGQSRRLHGVV